MNVYQKKAQSYLDLSDWITKHRNYSSTNEWGCHELAALFYEIVLNAKQIVSKRDLPHNDHRQIIESLRKINSKLAASYHQLFVISRKVRYEEIKVSPEDRNRFILLYKKFKIIAKNL